VTSEHDAPGNSVDLPGLDQIELLFVAAGGTDFPYLRHHYPRYLATKRNVCAAGPLPLGSVVLDVGAHWLHQAALYASDRCHVFAMDLPATMARPEVQAFAQTHDITLLEESQLETAESLAALPESSVDLVLFTEIIEHITFNPVAMWKQIYRVLKPRGRIIVTTPNYYATGGRAWKAGRFLSGFGNGIEALDILEKHTYAHHWKEFSLRELIYYFCVLSPDFDCTSAKHAREYFRGYSGHRLHENLRWLLGVIPLLREELYLEVTVASKDHGIVVTPHW
jgi:2-polyprenyl-6-hydroxyphenyl methylase/3-demethylubiquinone-9 3-methyltransferase